MSEAYSDIDNILHLVLKFVLICKAKMNNNSQKNIEKNHY